MQVGLLSRFLVPLKDSGSVSHTDLPYSESLLRAHGLSYPANPITNQKILYKENTKVLCFLLEMAKLILIHQVDVTIFFAVVGKQVLIVPVVFILIYSLSYENDIQFLLLVCLSIFFQSSKVCSL